MADLPAMKTSPKFIFFSDFDGTITLADSNDFLTDNIGYGQAQRKQENKDTLEGRNTFRKSFEGMMKSVTAPYDECIDLLVKNIKLDPYFKEFYEWALQNNIPVVVLSSGMVPIISALLHHLVGPSAEHIQIVSNDVRAKPGKSMNEQDGWDLVFHDDSDFGHDKSLTIRPYAQLPEGQRPTMFYAGDGVSDLSAAKETDLLFAKEGNDLVTFCVREDIPFTTFRDWSSITETVQEIVAGKRTVKDSAQDGFASYQRQHPA
ncbi:MAG: hypothetical protein M1828_007407 [Chrysothrix sp. TS-e1954]|nr:MAG: hypothetical protein M1828_007407 [Chrysothrix sp. TS-e1954]